MIERFLTKFEQEVLEENSRANRWARLILILCLIILVGMIAAKYIGGAW